jgi:curli biogenesis system outer membrane secretion channel CsgG
LILLTFVLLSACTASVQSYKRPGVRFSDYKRIAVVRFDCSDYGAGQEVADTFGLELMRRGFNVIERSQLRAVINEEALVQSGLIESAKAALKVSGVDSIVVGSISSYNCRPGTIVAGSLVLSTNNCHVSLSMKMLDVQTGDILWAANGAHSQNDVNMTANKVLKAVIEALADQIPSIE